MQSAALSHFLHPNVTKRILNSELYGNTYTLDEVMGDLTDGIFKADVRKSVNSTRQSLQLYYVEQLLKVLSNEKSRHSRVAKSAMLQEVKRIDSMMKNGASPDGLTKAHRGHIRFLIEKFMEG